MATATHKQRVLDRLFADAKPAYPLEEAEARPVLEQLLYAVVREGTTAELADRAFAQLQERFFDWNEVRVSSAHELDEALEAVPDAGAKSHRLIALLQEVFEATYSFDLESLHKKGLKQSAKQLARYQAATDFAVAFVVQRTLEGHAVPIDTPTLRVLNRTGLVAEGDGEDAEAMRSGLEHQVPKSKGVLFTELMSQIAQDVCRATPNCPACPLRPDCPTGRANDDGLAAVKAKPR